MDATVTTSANVPSPLMVSIGDTSALSPGKSPNIDTGQMRSSSPFTPNSFHKSSLMSSSSPPAAATAGSPLQNEITHLSPNKETALIGPNQQQPTAAASVRDCADSVLSLSSDVETFNGKIVYNPDGSAYIIEGPDSDGSEVEAEISQEGSIIDARGLSPNCGTTSFPQIVSAFHISRSSAALYSALYGQALSQNSSNGPSNVGEVPMVHSYRVFSFRSKKSDSQGELENGLTGDEEEDEESKLKATNCSTVPVKPILMCFICKLSFGYTKSFIAHTIGEHCIVLNEEEKRVLAAKNTSAIIQGVGKAKEPLLSFLTPKSSPAPFCTPSQQQQQLEAKRLLAAQMAAVASAFRSSSLSTSSPNSLIISPEKAPTLPTIQSSNSPKSSATTNPEVATSNISEESLTKFAEPETLCKLEPSDENDENSENEEMDTSNEPNEPKQSTADSTQFASELADLANLEKFAKAAAAAAQQQMDLQSIAAAMAVAVAASNQNRTPSPANKNSKTPVSCGQPNSQNLLLTSSSPSPFSAITSVATSSMLSADGKSISLFSNAGDSEPAPTLLSSNTMSRPNISSNHPPLLMQHSRNSCKTLKCPKCNWHYKYQETLEIHMKEKHPENEMNCIYCLTNQPHPRLARGETYTCGYKPYRCDVCNYSTTTKGNLSIHMQSDKHINNVQELQNGNIPATAEHLLQSQALAAAVAQASAANGTGATQNTTTTSNVPISSAGTISNSSSGSPTPTSAGVNLAAIAAVAQQDAKNQLQKISQQSSTPTTNSSSQSTSASNSLGGKQKATWRCDVCNYETNVARNLRIHMTSEKHTHNIMVLKQNVTQMQQLSALQQAGIINQDQLLQFSPGLFAAAAAAAAGINNPGQSNDTGSAIQPEAAHTLADMAYNHALLMMASQQQQQQQQRAIAAIMQQQQANPDPKSMLGSQLLIPNGSQPTFDMEHPDPSLTGMTNAPYDDSCRLFHCCVCSTFTTDCIEDLSQHIQCDRTRTREDEVLMSVGGSYICKLCSYKTNLKANFQLHCKTDKHLQRLQHVNHIKEGGQQAEWKLKFINVSNPVQVRCNVCDYYTNSIHKLQMHTANPRHDICSRIFVHLQLNDIGSGNSNNRYYFCSLCSASTRTKISLIQHLNSVKHLRNESLRQLKHQTQPGGMKDSEDEIRDMFQVKELLPGEKITFENDDDQHQQQQQSAQLGQLGNNIVSQSLAGTGLDSAASSAVAATEQMFLKNALMEHAANSQFEAAKMAAMAMGAAAAANDNNADKQQSDQSNSAISCPFCPFSNSNELHVQLHILTSHQQQAQQAQQQQLQQLQQQASNIPATPPPSILCPLCQEPFHEKVTLENHLVEVHSVTKEGVQRLMLLVDTSDFDKFVAKKKKQQQQHQHQQLQHIRENNCRRDTVNSHATASATAADEDDEECRRSEGSGDSGSKQAEDELLEAGNLLAAGNANNAILEHLLCPICNRMYLTLDELFSHMTSQLHIKPMVGGMFQCWRPGCNQPFKTIVATQQHFKDHHFLKCAKLANSSANLASNAPVSDRHVYKYRCSQCSLAFKTFEKLQLHSQYHLIRAATQCVICSRSFRSVESLQKHVDSAHSDMNEEELEQYKTSLMNNQLLFALRSNGGILDPSTTELLKKESSRFDGNDSMEMDDDEAIDLANSNQHNKDDDDHQLMDTSDPNNVDNLSNVINGNSSESSLEDYLNSQSVAEDNYNDPNRKYKCHRCKVAFTRQSYLTSHNKTLLHRKGEKMSYPMEKYLDPNRPFKCEICKESFTQKNILLVHYNSVSHLHKLKQSMKESSAAVAASVAAAGNIQLTESESEGENKPFRCNLCKVSYSNAPALDSHIRSSLHHTRTTKLHELALSGQLDLSLSLIERPDTLETNNNHPSKANANNDQCHSKPTSTPSPCPTPNKLPDMLAGLTEQQQQALAFQQAAINFAIATGQNPAAGQSQLMQLAGQSPFTCGKCGAAFISQDAQFQHQQLCGLFGNAQPNTALQIPQPPKTPISNFQAPICKTKPHLYKNLLESWGFEIVMQFNESNQKKKKIPDVKQEQDGTEETEVSEIEPKVEEEPDEPECSTSDAPPEINRCRCDICLKEFSSIWVLKAHREEIHKDVVPLDVVESFADEYRTEFERKFSNGNDDETNDSTVEESSNALTNSNDQNNQDQQQQSQQQQKPQPITFPGSSISNSNINNINNNDNHNSNPNANQTSNNSNYAEQNVNNQSNAAQNAMAMNANLAQFMPNLPPNASPNDIAAANQMAAAQLQFGQLLMSMGLAGMAAGMPMQAGMNVPFAAAAAMGIPPHLIPVMMADPMMAAAAAFNNPALAAAAAAQMNPNQSVNQGNVSESPSPAPAVSQSNSISQTSVSQASISSQAAAAAAAAAAQQKRARTRISDEQLKVLRQYFDINNSPTEEHLIEMSQKSGLPMKVIKHWFRNTLFKERQRNKDSPYNFNNPPSTFLNLDEYEKTGETKIFTIDEMKKNEPVPVVEPPTEIKETIVIPKPPAEYESETEAKNCSNDFKDSSSAKDTDYNSSDDEEMKRHDSKNLPPAPPSQSELSAQLQKQQAQFQAQFQQQAQEFDQLTKAMALNINSPQPSESSMSSNSESTSKTANTATSSMFAGLSNFGSGLSGSQNMTSSPLFAFDAAQRSQLAAAAAAAANSPTMMSNAGHSVSSHSSSGKRANRTRFTDYQIKVLQEFFESNAYPKDDDLEYLSKLLNLSPRVIVVWFQNARQKARKVYENQPPTTPIGEDDGSGRFQRTPGLNYQCKKCLQVFQRYYELIKHQKSSCFKDENPLAAQIRMAAEARAQASSPGSSTNCDAPSTPMDCSRSATATPEKIQPVMSMLTSPGSVSVTSPSPSGMSLTPNHKSSPPSIETQTFRCDKCTKVFNRFDMWRDHQIEHIVNTNLFNTASGNPFASMMQMDGLHLQQQQQPPLPPISPQQNISPNSSIFQQGIKRKQVTDDDDDDEESHDFDSMSGNGGGSNSGDQAQRDKRLRTTILPEQLDFLYQKYQIESNPSRKMLESIAKEVGLKKRVVQVWFQNTRARERKGQFRAHQQVIHKRCPFCRALFKARSALESHLATRHADQYTKGDINIDALPDGDPDEDGDSSVNEGNLDNVQMADVMKRYYEDSFKKYLDELNIQGKGGSQLPAEFALKMKTALDQSIVPKSTSAAAVSATVTNSTLLNPLDLSQTLSMNANRHNSNGEDEGFDDTRSEEFDSDAEEEIDFDYSQCSNPPSPISQAGHVASNNASQHSANSSNHRGIINSNSKRFRTQINSQMLKVMKSVFADYKTPTMAECETLGREIGLPKRVVQVWFQNARAKEKKARIIFAKTFGREFESNTPPIEDCKICKVRYNFKLSTTAMQEHLFSKTHIQKLRQQIDLMKKSTVEGQDDNSCDFPVASGNPVPATMLVNPHSTTSVFPTNTIDNVVNNSSTTATAASDAANNKAANNLMQQLQLIQGLAAAAQTTGQMPLNFSELFNGNNGNSSMNGVRNNDDEDDDDDDNELVIHHGEDDNGDDDDTDKDEDNNNQTNSTTSNNNPLDNNASFSQFMQYAVTSFKK